MTVSPKRQEAARAIRQKWIDEREKGVPYPLTMRQVAVWLAVDVHRVKTLRMARQRIDRIEARRTGIDPPPYIPLRTALCRAWLETCHDVPRNVAALLNGTAELRRARIESLYDAETLEAWVIWSERRDPQTGDIRHATSPGRPGKVEE